MPGFFSNDQIDWAGTRGDWNVNVAGFTGTAHNNPGPSASLQTGLEYQGPGPDSDFSEWGASGSLAWYDTSTNSLHANWGTGMYLGADSPATIGWGVPDQSVAQQVNAFNDPNCIAPDGANAQQPSVNAGLADVTTAAGQSRRLRTRWVNARRAIFAASRRRSAARPS